MCLRYAGVRGGCVLPLRPWRVRIAVASFAIARVLFDNNCSGRNTAFVFLGALFFFCGVGGWKFPLATTAAATLGTPHHTLADMPHLHTSSGTHGWATQALRQLSTHAGLCGCSCFLRHRDTYCCRAAGTVKMLSIVCTLFDGGLHLICRLPRTVNISHPPTPATSATCHIRERRPRNNWPCIALALLQDATTAGGLSMLTIVRKLAPILGSYIAIKVV